MASSWRRVVLAAAATSLLIALSGCVLWTAGEGGGRDWRNLAAKAVPPDEGEVEFVSVVYFYTDLDARQYEDRKVFKPSHAEMHRGVFELTRLSVIVLEWDRSVNRYEVVFALPYSEISATTVATWGARRGLVITGNDQRSRIFEMQGPQGQVLSRGETQKAFELVTAHTVRETASP